jgi:hypothetical protein
MPRRAMIADEGEAEKKSKRRRLNMNPVDKWYDTVIMRIGGRAITRRDLVKSGCANMRSINRVARFVRQHQIKGAADLWQVDPVWCVNRCKQFGIFSVFAAMHVLQVLGVPHPDKWGEGEKWEGAQGRTVRLVKGRKHDG